MEIDLNVLSTSRQVLRLQPRVRELARQQRLKSALACTYVLCMYYVAHQAQAGLQNMLLMLTIAFGASVDQNHEAIVDLD